MTPGVAPSAFRRPISRTRSVTDTSMMFITPMPPTNREIPATPPRRTVRVLFTELEASASCCCEVMVKSASAGVVMSWSESSSASASW